ncbi:MAG: hypothetical protein JW861_07385 [Bacteroidales bacterium]|nr:hypothetical protein [Bacteroidales bacterium]
MKKRWLFLVAFAVLLAITSGTAVHCFIGTGIGAGSQKEDYSTYPEAWKKVDSLVNIGLPRTALEIVDSIYHAAQVEENHPQVVKSLLYRFRLQAAFEENIIKGISEELNALITVSGPPLKQILHSILGEIYWNYYQSNRYRFLERTYADFIKKEDITTWDLRTLQEEVFRHYQASLEDPKILKTNRIGLYDAILEGSGESRMVRPTLYDFLAHRAVDFFMNDESALTRPARQFEVNQDDYLAEAGRFVKFEPGYDSPLSGGYEAFRIFREILDFHLGDEDPAALIDADLKRLQYMYNKAVMPEKDSLYSVALGTIRSGFRQHPASTDAGYQMASHQYDLGLEYQPKVSGKNRWNIRTALEICREEMSAHPGSGGAKRCKLLEQQILETGISVQAPAGVSPGQKFLGLVKFRNLKQLHFRLISISPEADRDYLKQYPNRKELIAQYAALPFQHSFSQALPDTGDYQWHAAEVPVTALAEGYYILLASGSDAFNPDQTFMAYTPVWSTDISYITRKDREGTYQVYVLDRETGMPLKNVKTKLFERFYNYNSRTYEHQFAGEYFSDEAGYLEITPSDEGGKARSFFLEFEYKEQHLLTENYFYQRTPDYRGRKPDVRTFFFTDRSVYRPGQTIWFKGIVTERSEKSTLPQKGKKTRVEFFDANNQQVEVLEFTTNEFGSFHGSFTAPVTGLTGMMNIRNESGSVAVKVEEYKRPEFEVTFRPMEGAYKLNESLQVPGKTVSFSGAPVDHARVSYRVVRTARFPYRIFGVTDFMPLQGETEIVSGFTETDGDGAFSVPFQALPDLSVPESAKPVFNYRITAEVTAVNGETRSGETTVSVGYNAMIAGFDIPEQVDRSVTPAFRIITTNPAGRPLPSEGEIAVFRLSEPGRLFRTRLWEAPDEHVMDQDDFIRDFPYDPFGEEYLPTGFEKEEQLFHTSYRTPDDSLLVPEGMAGWEPGRYLATILTRDAFGSEVRGEQIFTLFDPQSSSCPVHEIFWSHLMQEEAEPGSSSTVLVGSAGRDLRVVCEVVCERNIISRQWIRLNSEMKRITIPIGKDCTGNCTVNLVAVLRNRPMQKSLLVRVPQTDRQLGVTFETFRDRLLPGQKEEWKIRIDRKTGERIAAEVLTSMYDASLDAISPHDWSFHIFLDLFGLPGWDVFHAFRTEPAFLYHPPAGPLMYPAPREYDHLNWFGFHYFGSGFRHSRFGKDDHLMLPPGQPFMPEMDDMGAQEAVQQEAEPLPKTGESPAGPAGRISLPAIQIRRDFRETAFFYPALRTDDSGRLVVSFTMPESTTRWKLLGLAHTEDLSHVLFKKEITTAKDLMVIPNLPRFLREGDRIRLSAGIVNLSGQSMKGEASLSLFDALTQQPLENITPGGKYTLGFESDQGETALVAWDITVPSYSGLIGCRFEAVSGQFTDGEETSLPVLTNRTLVTETLPMPVRGKEERTFRMERLAGTFKQTGLSLSHHRFTVEFTSNPIWLAVQSLPVMMEGTRESSDEIFRRYYANRIGSHLVSDFPEIRQVFDSWIRLTPEALASPLEKNQELKNLLLEETPWVTEAGEENRNKRRMAMLFDENRMRHSMDAALMKLITMQSPNGGWPWFDGMRDNRSITQEIVLGFAHLRQLGIMDPMKEDGTRAMLLQAITYLDARIQEDYEKLSEHHPDEMDKNHLTAIQIQYLYARSSFFKDIPLPADMTTPFQYFRDQATRYWLEFNTHLQGMIALAMHHLGVKSLPSLIAASLKENASYHEEMGMYWGSESGGFRWYESPVETQAMMAEVFTTITGDTLSVDLIRTYLLRQKQTRGWKTSRATAEAVFALLERGDRWITGQTPISVKVGSETIDPLGDGGSRIEAGTGYFKHSWPSGSISSEMADIKVTNENPGIAWGAAYWQYFEDMDKITGSSSPLHVEKQLLREVNTSRGPILETVDGDHPLSVGDKIKVRMVIRSDRDMEFIHLKDLRASGLEPPLQVSGYRYQDGLGYYQNPRDAAMNFFFDLLPKGTWVIEYPLIVSHSGSFSNGITTIQCLYAPEFAAHTEGTEIRVE